MKKHHWYHFIYGTKDKWRVVDGDKTFTTHSVVKVCRKCKAKMGEEQYVTTGTLGYIKVIN